VLLRPVGPSLPPTPSIGCADRALSIATAHPHPHLLLSPARARWCGPAFRRMPIARCASWPGGGRDACRRTHLRFAGAPELFGDAMHLNEAGGIEFSRRLAQLAGKWLSAPRARPVMLFHTPQFFLFFVVVVPCSMPRRGPSANTFCWRQLLLLYVLERQIHSADSGADAIDYTAASGSGVPPPRRRKTR